MIIAVIALQFGRLIPKLKLMSEDIEKLFVASGRGSDTLPLR